MKILITGKDSYIGKNVKNWLINAGNEVSELDMLTDKWRDEDFSCFDSIIHVAGIAHDKIKKKNAPLYFKVNRDLAIETAIKARDSHVKQFVFVSSMSVYGNVKVKNITETTPLLAKDCYGASKLEADLALQKMNSDDFKVAVLRPPMIFGEGCKGNFPKLVTLSLKMPLFPKVKNQRSMLYIDNFSEAVNKIISNNLSGVFFPQDGGYYTTTDLAVAIAKAKNKRLRTTRLFNPMLWLAYPFIPQLKKLFGSLTYDTTLSEGFSSLAVDKDDTLKFLEKQD